MKLYVPYRPNRQYRRTLYKFFEEKFNTHVYWRERLRSVIRWLGHQVISHRWSGSLPRQEEKNGGLKPLKCRRQGSDADFRRVIGLIGEAISARLSLCIFMLTGWCLLPSFRCLSCRACRLRICGSRLPSAMEPSFGRMHIPSV